MPDYIDRSYRVSWTKKFDLRFLFLIYVPPWQTIPPTRMLDLPARNNSIYLDDYSTHSHAYSTSNIWTAFTAVFIYLDSKSCSCEIIIDKYKIGLQKNFNCGWQRWRVLSLVVHNPRHIDHVCGLILILILGSSALMSSFSLATCLAICKYVCTVPYTPYAPALRLPLRRQCIQMWGHISYLLPFKINNFLKGSVSGTLMWILGLMRLQEHALVSKPVQPVIIILEHVAHRCQSNWCRHSTASFWRFLD